MAIRTLKTAVRGLTAVMASLFVISSIGYEIADANRSQVDSFLGTSSYEIDVTGSRFPKDYDTPEKMMAAAKEMAIKQGREGFVLMKNDNSALPIASGKTIALFGAAAYKPYMQSAGDLKAGNDDRKNLDEALVDLGYTLDPTMKAIYDNILSDYTVSTRFGNTTITYNNGYVTSPGDMKDYQIREVPADKYTDANLGKASADWKDTVAKNKKNNVGICVFARGAGESNTYAPGTAVNFAGEKTGKDPLALSDDELSVIQAAKDTCETVIVLLNTGNNMEIGAIAKGGSHEVDAIGYMGVINDYQCIGIAEVLTGKANATGAMADTYVYSNANNPAVMNFGGSAYADAEVAESDGTDPRYPGTQISNGGTSSFGGSRTTYSGENYIVEAEGIYVGYQYYETRYYDSIVNPKYNATSTKGSLSGAWNYANEVVYTFGHGLSYYDYEQKITNVTVDRSVNGNVVATVAVTNHSTVEADFLAQLYVQQPYTQYDIDNLVEKPAVMFLNSKKVKVAAGATETVQISVPTRYLASYDYTNAKTYILDPGEYYFTAAAGSHEAVNNFLTKQGYTGDAKGTGEVVIWNELTSLDKTTYAVSNGKAVTNVADNADLNYWLPGTVTYLSRHDWEGTYPINYNEKAVSIAASAKKDEWIKEIQGRQYELDNTGEEVKNAYGDANSYKFGYTKVVRDSEGNIDSKKSTALTYEQLTDINNEYWQNLVDCLSVDEAVGAVVHGGGQSDTLASIENPVVGQNEGVNGVKGGYEVYKTDSEGKILKDEKGKNIVEKTYYFGNCSSQTLLGTSFNPELAYETGLIQGNAGLWLQKQSAWGTGLTLRRTAYNGRNYEYISEDPMLANRIGEGLLRGTAEKGFICGPKHMGFNDQEHNRAGIAVYMNEQKFRMTDLRAFEGGLRTEEGGGLGVMIAFNRIGATNASHHQGMILEILRGEWAFKGVISTDLASRPYFDGVSCVMAGITQIAEFGSNNSTISGKTDADGNTHDSNWAYLSVESCKNDAKFVNQARENLKYQLYTFANSAVSDIATKSVTPWWDSALQTMQTVTMAAAIATAVVWALLSLFPEIKKEEK